MKVFLYILSYVVFASMCVSSVVLRYEKLVAEYERKLSVYEYFDNYIVWTGIFKTTLYTNSKNGCAKTRADKAFGITKSGLMAIKYRTVAVDTDYIPLGSILIDMKEGNIYIAEDTGSKVKGYSVDIFIGEGTKDNIDFALKWGCRDKIFMVIENKVGTNCKLTL